MTELRALWTLACRSSRCTRGHPMISSTAATPRTMQVSISVKPRRSGLAKRLPPRRARAGAVRDRTGIKAGAVPKAKSLGDTDRTESVQAAPCRDVRGVQGLAHERADRQRRLQRVAAASVVGLVDPPQLIEEGAQADAEQMSCLAPVAL